MFPSCHPLLEEHHSPINLDHKMIKDNSLGSLHLEGFNVTQAGYWTLKNDGHSVVLQFGSGMSVSGGGLPDVYHTIQLHFHWGDPATNGSEHTVHRRRYPMEVVYADHVHFGHISQKLSSVAYKGQTTKVKPFPLMSLLPKHNMSQYYRYYGSLTTPPCSQAVVWTLYEVPIYISWSQLAQFTSQIFSTEEDAAQVTPLQNNFRHIHPTFRRIVLASKDAKLPTGMGSPLLGSAVSVHLLPIMLLGSFISGL
ncbi:Carbonic anhydrase 12 [Channa argus]|uniref:Carbonic anhydrase 12 n=1 Tax=Channa argus TaxID=215402 RepID=A0A6G1QIB7_CHAAH|nr:Carbonic anhydrase 12 [Channa argus]